MSAYSGNDIFFPEDRCGELFEPLPKQITLALAAKAGEVCANDGATYAAEFLANLDIEHLNAMALALYASNESFRKLFAESYGESVCDDLIKVMS